MTTITIIADNPSDAGNNQPVFNSEGWMQEIILYCEEESQSQDRCTKAEIDLGQFFTEIDNGQDLILSVFEDSSPDATSDDNYALVINVGQDGIATYDPISMFFYDSDMGSWTLENVIFVATDPFGSKEISLPVTFTVIGINFEINIPEVTVVKDGESITFSGVGLPGKTVTALIDKVPANSTIVNSDSTWSLDISSSRFDDGPVTPEFRYVGSDYNSGVQISVGAADEGMSTLMIAIISIVILSLLGGAFVYFFVEIEEDSSADEEDSASDSTADEESTEGWIWDEESNEWIEDPNY
jgi:hypothetical protein